MPLFCVETITSFRTRYIIECKSLEHAYDTVAMADSGYQKDMITEFSQKHLGEQILDGFEITYEQFDSMNDQLNTDSNDSGSPWMGRKIINIVDYSNHNE